MVVDGGGSHQSWSQPLAPEVPAQVNSRAPAVRVATASPVSLVNFIGFDTTTPWYRHCVSAESSAASSAAHAPRCVDTAVSTLIASTSRTLFRPSVSTNGVDTTYTSAITAWYAGCRISRLRRSTARR